MGCACEGIRHSWCDSSQMPLHVGTGLGTSGARSEPMSNRPTLVVSYPLDRCCTWLREGTAMAAHTLLDIVFSCPVVFESNRSLGGSVSSPSVKSRRAQVRPAVRGPLRFVQRKGLRAHQPNWREEGGALKRRWACASSVAIFAQDRGPLAKRRTLSGGVEHLSWPHLQPFGPAPRPSPAR